MKKYIKIISLSLVLFTSCSDVLDKEPLALIADSNIWQDESLLNAYLNRMYLDAPFLNQTGESGFNVGLIGAMGAEFRTMGPWQTPYKAAIAIINENGAPGAMNYWGYNSIRRANEFILRLNTESNLDQQIIDKKIAEARFLRAFYYFEMVKRYGGVPIITVPQSIDEEDLFLERDTEEAVYDFIASEMDAIADSLSDTPNASSGRASKWAALALKSRAMTYAGSIGEFGTPVPGEYVGISNANKYWQMAYDTSKEIIENSGHALFNKYASDKTKNFQQLFLEENNSEVIFSEIFDETLLRTHSFSGLTMPSGFEVVWGSNFPVFYDTVRLFDFADGSSGDLSESEITAQTWSSEELFGTRDARFKASIFYPEAAWQGSKVYFHSSSSGTLAEDWPAKAPNRNKNRTGFHLRKRLDESVPKPRGGLDGTDYIVFRLGEVYLNLAEAAFHLGKVGEATNAINAIRSRAGMPARTGLTWENIIQERRCELFAEDHSYWDFRRWRIAVDVLDDLRTRGVRYAYNADTKKYTITFVNGEGAKRVFKDRNYYFPVGPSILADNPDFKENPGY